MHLSDSTAMPLALKGVLALSDVAEALGHQGIQDYMLQEGSRGSINVCRCSLSTKEASPSPHKVKSQAQPAQKQERFSLWCLCFSRQGFSAFLCLPCATTASFHWCLSTLSAYFLSKDLSFAIISGHQLQHLPNPQTNPQFTCLLS